jgi:PAS domain S-box-containing protein
VRLLSNAVSAFAEATSDYKRLLAIIARSAGEVIGDICTVVLLENGDLHTRAKFTTDPELDAYLDEMARNPIRAGEPSAAWKVLESAQASFQPKLDLRALEGRMVQRNYELFVKLGVHSLVMVPMRVRGAPVGLLALWRYRADRPGFDELDLELAQDLASHAALAIANAQLVEALRESEQVRKAQQELTRANRFLDAIIEHIPDMLFVKDAKNLAFTRFNRAGEELIGLPRSALLGKTDHDLFPPEDAAFFQAKDRETLASKQQLEIPEEPIQTPSGERWLHTKKVPILDLDGSPLYLLGISHDITDRKRADAELRASKEHAEAVGKELEAFSYSVAHDLRTPLRGIDGFSQALLEDYGDKLDDVGRRYLGRVREAAQRMAVLIDDLLALSRVTRSELVRERLDLTALAYGSISRLQRLEPDRVVELVIEPGLWVEGDPRLLAIALDNLFGNAWKFTAKVAAPRIELGSEPAANGRSYFVRDNGAGFDPQYAHKLFGVFQRLHTESEFPGTGIGLATVARIIHRHRGRVWADGSPGAGATFHFTLLDLETP